MQFLQSHLEVIIKFLSPVTQLVTVMHHLQYKHIQYIATESTNYIVQCLLNK